MLHSVKLPLWGHKKKKTKKKMARLMLINRADQVNTVTELFVIITFPALPVQLRCFQTML